MQTNDMSLQTIKEIGISVRSFLEDIRPKTPWGCTLDGACAVGAFLTCDLLQSISIQSTMVVGSGSRIGHCWVECQVGKQTVVLDTTATQFICRIEPVLVLPEEDYKKLAFYKDIETKVFVKDEIDLFNALQDWPDEQKPSYYREEIYDSFGFWIDS